MEETHGFACILRGACEHYMSKLTLRSQYERTNGLTCIIKRASGILWLSVVGFEDDNRVGGHPSSLLTNHSISHTYY